jgi:hypothetical protein
MDFSCTGFVAISARCAAVKIAEPGMVPAVSRKAWHWTVERSTPSDAERMRRPHTAGRSMLELVWDVGEVGWVQADYKGRERWG